MVALHMVEACSPQLQPLEQQPITILPKHAQGHWKTKVQVKQACWDIHAFMITVIESL